MANGKPANTSGNRISVPFVLAGFSFDMPREARPGSLDECVRPSREGLRGLGELREKPDADYCPTGSGRARPPGP
jgi:hypothetical protein